MKSFKEYIIEEILSFDDALKIFNIDKVPSSKSEFDKLYKQLALKNHPDLGGSTEAMKKLNMAKEVLSKHLGQGKSEIEKAEEKARKEQYNNEKEQSFNIAMNFFKKIDLEVYKAYFKSIFNKDFFAETEVPTGYNGRFAFGQSPYINIEIFTKSRDIVFYVHLGCDIFRLWTSIYGQKGLSTSNVTFDYYIRSEAFIENKKQVITKEKYIKSSDASVLTKPETLFPKARIEKLASGKVRENSILKKRDFESLFKMKYKGDQYKDWYFIPYRTDGNIIYWLSIYRTVLLKQAAYTFSNIYISDKSKQFAGKSKSQTSPTPKINYFPETQETFDAMKMIFDFAMSGKSDVEIVKKIDSFAN